MQKRDLVQKWWEAYKREKENKVGIQEEFEMEIDIDKEIETRIIVFRNKICAFEL